jgi:hypothetical protein
LPFPLLSVNDDASCDGQRDDDYSRAACGGRRGTLGGEGQNKPWQRWRASSIAFDEPWLAAPPAASHTPASLEESLHAGLEAALATAPDARALASGSSELGSLSTSSTASSRSGLLSASRHRMALEDGYLT